MQLILDTETSIDIKEKMTTLEETSEKSVSDVIGTLKTVFNNGNKENIHSQENVMKIPEKEVNGIEENDTNEYNSILPEEDKIENNECQLANVKKESCEKIITNGTTEDKEDIQETKANTEIENNQVQTLDESLITVGSGNDSVEQDSGLTSTNVGESNNLSSTNVESEINSKETLIGDVEEEQESIVKKMKCIEHVSDNVGETSMEVENELENLKQCNVTTNGIDTEITPELSNPINMIEDTVNVSNDVTDDATVNLNIDMEVEVSIPETSNEIKESKKIDEETLECDDVVVADHQSNMLKDQVEGTTNTDDKVILEPSLTFKNDVPFESETTIENAIVGDTLSKGENTVAVTTSVDKSKLNKKSSLKQEIKKNLSPDDEKSGIENEVNDTEILGNPATVNEESSLVKTTNDEQLALKNKSSALEEKTSTTIVTDKDIVMDIVSSMSKEPTENTPSGNAKEVDVIDTKEAVNNAADSDQINKKVLAYQSTEEVKKKPFTKLSNTLDILSDDEDDSLSRKMETLESTTNETIHEKQTINIEDDDDIMLIDEDIGNKDSVQEATSQTTDKVPEEIKEKDNSRIDLEALTEKVESDQIVQNEPAEVQEDILSCQKEILKTNKETKKEDQLKEDYSEKPLIEKPLLPENFLKSCKKNLVDMTRDDLEEFCILKIVESIVDRSNLSEIKSKLKEMAQNIEEYKKKTMMLNKQNRDLQVVLKSVQEEQKKNVGNPSAVTPLKITRSVGMQVFMIEKPGMRKKLLNNPTTTSNTSATNNNINRNGRTPNQSPKSQKPATVVNQTIPVPRLVLANSPVAKIPASTVQSTPNSTQAKTPSPVPNGVRNSPPVQKIAEKRPINRVQSVTVDLTDDEPPTKIAPRSSPAPPVRLVASQNLLAPRPAFGQTLNNPRKVYIPISGPQNQNIRPGQAIMLKTVPTTGPGPRPRAAPPHMARLPQNVQTVRMQSRIIQNRHPAPLPDAVKQYQPPNWKALPPAPDLKLSKVENGIVISWKIEGYQEDSYEEIASYQLYAYQETSSPPSTALWKKIGDVKALPLPMACTLTHVMAGFKYYFAVRAVDIRSRLGPFSLPGSILLLNKL